MKICYLANVSDIHTKVWLSYFVKQGHEVHLITFEKGEIEGVNVHHIKMLFTSRNKTFPLKLFYIRKIKKLIKEIKPHVVHAHYISNYGYFASKCNFHPLIMTTWGSDVISLKLEPWIFRYVKKRLSKSALKKADVVTTDGIHIIPLLEKYGAKRIETIHFGVDVNKFKTKEDRHFSDSGIYDIVSTRKLYPIYDLETLVKAVPLVLREFPETYFHIFGDGSEMQKLIDLTISLGKEYCKHIKFEGRYEYDNLPEILNYSDLYVSTSLSDAGLASSTAEAMSCGLPVLVSDVADNKKWVKDYQVFPAKDSMKLAGKICRMLRSPEIRKFYSEWNRNQMVEFNNYEVEMQRMDKLYCNYQKSSV